MTNKNSSVSFLTSYVFPTVSTLLTKNFLASVWIHVTVLIVGLVTYFGGYLKDALTKISCPLVGEEYVPGEKRGEATCSNSKTASSIEDMFK